MSWLAVSGWLLSTATLIAAGAFAGWAVWDLRAQRRLAAERSRHHRLLAAVRAWREWIGDWLDHDAERALAATFDELEREAVR